MDGPVWELGAVKGVHLAAPPGYGSRTQKEKINGQPIEKSNEFSRLGRGFAGAVRRRENSLLFSLGQPLIFLFGCNCHIQGGQLGARLLPHLAPILAHPQAPNLGTSVC